MNPNELQTVQNYLAPSPIVSPEIIRRICEDLKTISAGTTGGAASTNWGPIGGDINDQTDLIAYVASQVTSGDVLTDNVIYVTRNGTASGEVNNLQAPFADPYQARAAAVAAGGVWTIVTYPGTYVVPAPLLLTDGINYLFMGKGQLTTSSGTAVFQTVASATSIVHGAGWVFTDTGNRYILRSSTTGSQTLFVANQMNSSGGNTIWLDNNSIVSVTANRIFSLFGYAAVESDTGYTGTFTCYGEAHIECAAGGGATFQIESGNFSVKARTITGYVAAIKTENTSITDVLSFQADSITNGAGAGWTIWMTGASPFQSVRANTITSTGNCSVVSGGSTILTVICPSIINSHATTYGNLHAENTSTLICIGAVLTNTGVGPGDHLDAEAGTTIKLIGVAYDVTKTDISGTILNWNGNVWEPIMKCINVGTGCSVQNSYAPGAIIDFASKNDCVLKNYTLRNGSVTFTANTQTKYGKVEFAATIDTSTPGSLSFDNVLENNSEVTFSLLYNGAGDVNIVASAPIFAAGNYELTLDPFDQVNGPDALGAHYSKFYGLINSTNLRLVLSNNGTPDDLIFSYMGKMKLGLRIWPQ